MAYRRIFLIALALCFAVPAAAQTYPDRPIRLIVPFPAGGGVDTMARILANKLTDVVKQPVLVEHKPGAGGNIGGAETGSRLPIRNFAASRDVSVQPCVRMRRRIRSQASPIIRSHRS